MSQDKPVVTNWERESLESEISYSAFLVWLHHARPRPGCRRLEELVNAKIDSGEFQAEKIGYRTFARMKKKFRWDLRARAFDNHMATVDLRAREAAVTKASETSELQQYRERAKIISQTVGSAGVLLLTQAIGCIKKLKPGAKIESSISTAMRTAKDMLQFEVDSTAVVLGIDDIIGTLARADQHEPGEDD